MSKTNLRFPYVFGQNTYMPTDTADGKIFLKSLRKVVFLDTNNEMWLEVL